MDETRALARIREIARLGLPGEILVLAVLREMQRLIPRCGAAFFWLDASGCVVNCCADILPPPQTSASAPAAGCCAFARAVLEANGAAHVVAREVPHRWSTRGMLHAYRSAGEGSFTPHEAALVEQAVRCLGHVPAPVLAPQDGACGRSSLSAAAEEFLVCDASGRIVHATHGCRTLLLLAAGMPLNAASLAAAEDAALALLRTLCARLARDGSSSRYARRTRWGTLSFHLRRMVDARQDAGLVAVRLYRHEPSELQLFDALERSALSARQRQVALHVSLGRSNAQIGAALCVSANTVSYHLKSLFARFDVHNRAGLTSRLAAAGVVPAE